ncbi:hypothetical protein [Phenylobacterium sp.]|uniref:hypothetical protein n=1 Tax=Phenylobacterium sp. TaxID=1871053 RepID=UPI002ED9D23A
MSDVSPVQKFLGGALMAVGGLIAALCGLCTLGLIGFGVADTFGGGSSGGDLLGAAAIATIIGGVPTVLGVLLFAWGRRLYAPRRATGRDRLAVFSDDPEDRP